MLSPYTVHDVIIISLINDQLQCTVYSRFRFQDVHSGVLDVYGAYRLYRCGLYNIAKMHRRPRTVVETRDMKKFIRHVGNMIQ